MNPQISNPNDLKVVEFHNTTNFDFTPDMGCMYDSRPIFGNTGVKGIAAGEKITLPYHVGHRLAENLAKIVMVRRAPIVDAAGIPTGVPLWSDTSLESLKSSYLSELYTENKPITETETDRLMAKVEEYRKTVEKLIGNSEVKDSTTEDKGSETYQDKGEVIAELEKNGIAHDKRKSKVELEKLLNPNI